MKGIVFTHDEKMYVKEFDQPLYKSVGEVVGGYIEVVHPRGLREPLCFICNEEGLLEGLPMNLIGSLWYGTQHHGHPIVGNIVVMKEGWTDDGPDIVGLEEQDILLVKSIAHAKSGGRIVDLDEQEAENEETEPAD